MPAKSAKRSRRFAPFGILFGLVGLLLFVYFVRRAGLDEIEAGVKRLGSGFVLILMISAVRHVVRSIAWVICVQEPYRLRFRDAFAGRLMGDALGNLIPLASVALSEPSKAFFVRDRLPTVVAFSALAIENIFYSLSVCLFIFAGTAVLLLNYSVPKALGYAGITALVVTLAVICLLYVLLNARVRFVSGLFTLLSRSRVTRNRMEKNLMWARSLEDHVFSFYQRGKKNFVTIFALEIAFHLAGVAEIFTTLSFISVIHPTLVAAFVLESVNRVINITFKFIPLRTGVDEAGTGMLARVLGLATATGVTLAIIRKGRDIFWSAVGVLLLLAKGFTWKQTVAEMSVEPDDAQSETESYVVGTARR